MSLPHYHDQPATLDERIEIPEDAPLAQGHTEEKAADVRDALEDHKDAIRQAAENPDVGPGDPTNPPGENPQGETDETDETDDVPDGSIDDVLDWVGDDHARAQRALGAENCKSTPRSSLITKLESI